MMENKEDKTIKGNCWKCHYYDSFQNYCDYYKIILNGNGYEPTCNNSELKDEPCRKVKALK